ncbi:MAG TPA: hypothetical protein VFI84_04085 [Candidatus Saccharimonadales bacterium]|nr:hypothetical protein [Candidatus Saccharimonadales bacterium]
MVAELFPEPIIPSEDERSSLPHLEVIIGGLASISEVAVEDATGAKRPSWLRPQGVISYRTEDVTRWGYPGDFILPGYDNCSGRKH